MKIGLFGGSFDPVHNGHMNLAKVALKTLKLDKIVFIPAYKSPFKNRKLSTPGARVCMLDNAFNGNRNYGISCYELYKGRKVFTYETVKEFRKLFTDDEIYLLMGSDSAQHFKKWKNYKYLLKNCRVVAFHRPGLGCRKIKGVDLCDLNRFESSTLIRNRVKMGKSIHGMVSKRVEDFIERHGLYKGVRNGIL